ncbi:helix-turn-helix domain-containing protein (plasmid) [Lactococcus lactis]|uniref:Rgg/GadR/MutR family transcriptional regulator n=1 Tax=Lactococcus lactis TaxID=1358 RepID=UPI003313C8D9
MTYKKYGEVFKELRQQHNLTLEDFKKIGISKSTISQFENGKSLLSFDKLDMALQEMNVMMSAYILIINDGESEYFLDQFEEIDYARLQGDEAKLKNIYKRNLKYETKVGLQIGIAAKAGYEDLDIKSLRSIEEYFEKCVFWTRFDLFLLVHTADQISNQLLLSVVERFFVDNSSYLIQRQDFKHLVSRIIFKAIMILIKTQKLDQAKYMISRFSDIIFEFDLAEKIILMFSGGCWVYSFESKKSGKRILNRCFRILTDINSINVRKMLKIEFENLTKEK